MTPDIKPIGRLDEPPEGQKPANGSNRMPAAARRRQILGVALEVFGQSGYHDTSMNAIASEAGVTKPVLYQHFASKRELFETLLAETGGALLRAVESAEAEETPRRRVEAGFRSFFQFFEDRPAAFSVLYGSSVATDPKFRRDVAQVRDSFSVYLTRLMTGMDRVDALAMAAGINGMSEGMIRHWMHLGRIRSADEMAALAARLAWSGVDGLTT